jgi:hypothetical protein
MSGHRGSLFVLSVLFGAAALLVAVGGPAGASAASAPSGLSSATRPTALPAAVPAVVGPTLTVTPAAGLVDGQTLSVLGTGTTPGSTFVFVECDPVALKIFTGQLPPEDNPNDGCEEQRNTVLFSDAAGVVAGTLAAQAVVATAAGVDDCRVDQCFVALFALAGGPSVQLQNLSFAPGACAAPGSCAVPADWSATSAARTAAMAPADTGVPIATRSHAVTENLYATPVHNLSLLGPVTGPWDGNPLEAIPLGSPGPPPPPVTGEGLVRLALDAPGTAWSLSSPRAAVVDVSVDGGPSQQLVLFRGANPFVYAGFTGPLTEGSHNVTVAPDPSLSVMDGHALHIEVRSVGLRVIAPDDPSYLAYAYAPVMYGRSTSTLHDTPLIDYAGSTPLGGGSVRLSYTVVWSHEDAGTGFVPFLELGSWGRLTDIENAISFTVAPDGTVSGATYLWGGVPLGYPDTQGAASETDVAFAGTYWGHHAVLRDATGNNDFSDQGTTGFRFQQAPVAPPAAGQPREAVMDANPWTYLVMGQEMDRWYTDVSTNPSSPQPGDARQYAYVQVGTTGTGVSSVAVDLQLAGSSTWYQSDLGSGYPLIGTGVLRTVIKMPVGWTSQAVTAARLRVFPAGAAASVTVSQLVVHALAPNWSESVVSTPIPVVAGGVVSDPVALRVRGVSPLLRHTAPSGLLAPFAATVSDSLGERLAGVPVTFAATAGPTVTFTGCGCAALVAVSGLDGTATSGPGTAGPAPGTTTVSASVPDALAPPAAFTLRVVASHAV